MRRQRTSFDAQLLSNVVDTHCLISAVIKPQNAAANVALNRRVQGGDSRNISGVPTHGIAQQC